MFKLSQEDQVLWLLPVLRGLPWLGIKPALGATNSASFPRLSSPPHISPPLLEAEAGVTKATR